MVPCEWVDGPARRSFLGLRWRRPDYRRGWQRLRLRFLGFRNHAVDRRLADIQLFCGILNEARRSRFLNLRTRDASTLQGRPVFRLRVQRLVNLFPALDKQAHFFAIRLRADNVFINLGKLVLPN
jgi:hypothetical protein